MAGKKLLLAIAVGGLIGLIATTSVKKKSITKKNGNEPRAGWDTKVKNVLKHISEWETLRMDPTDKDKPALFKAKASTGGVMGSGTMIFCVFL